MELIYIGDNFYHESGTMMSPIYTVEGKRSDWGFVQCALRDSQNVNIRQATIEEKAKYTKKLEEIKSWK